jgi:hypothetical protein
LFLSFSGIAPVFTFIRDFLNVFSWVLTGLPYLIKGSKSPKQAKILYLHFSLKQQELKKTSAYASGAKIMLRFIGLEKIFFS